MKDVLKNISELLKNTENIKLLSEILNGCELDAANEEQNRRKLIFFSERVKAVLRSRSFYGWLLDFGTPPASTLVLRYRYNFILSLFI